MNGLETIIQRNIQAAREALHARGEQVRELAIVNAATGNTLQTFHVNEGQSAQAKRYSGARITYNLLGAHKAARKARDNWRRNHPDYGSAPLIIEERA